MSNRLAHMARLLSVNVGLPRDIEWNGRVVHTGIWKDPMRGRCGGMLAMRNIKGMKSDAIVDEAAAQVRRKVKRVG